jgi:hypothetical protein
LNWKKFITEKRYYRIFGNHDDYFRGHALSDGTDSLAPVYPAVIFEDKEAQIRIFATHGCQGQGLHDAGDQVAAWGVFARYNWLLEILPNDEKGRFSRQAKKIRADFDRHEQFLYDWANAQHYDFLIAGHTHRPIYSLYGVAYSYEVLRRDIESGRLPLFTSYPEPGKLTEFEPAGPGEPRSLREAAAAAKVKPILETKINPALRAKMVKELDKEALGLDKKLIRSDESRGPGQTNYFNPGCGYLSEIPCIEILNGTLSLKFYCLSPDPERKLEWRVYEPKSKTVVRAPSDREK